MPWYEYFLWYPFLAYSAVGMFILMLEVVLRLIPSKKRISLLSLLARLLVWAGFLLQKLSEKFPERRKL